MTMTQLFADGLMGFFTKRIIADSVCFMAKGAGRVSTFCNICIQLCLSHLLHLELSGLDADIEHQ